MAGRLRGLFGGRPERAAVQAAVDAELIARKARMPAHMDAACIGTARSEPLSAAVYRRDAEGLRDILAARREGVEHSALDEMMVRHDTARVVASRPRRGLYRAAEAAFQRGVARWSESIVQAAVGGPWNVPSPPWSLHVHRLATAALNADALADLAMVRQYQNALIATLNEYSEDTRAARACAPVEYAEAQLFGAQTLLNFSRPEAGPCLKRAVDSLPPEPSHLPLALRIVCAKAQAAEALMDLNWDDQSQGRTAAGLGRIFRDAEGAGLQAHAQWKAATTLLRAHDPQEFGLPWVAGRRRIAVTQRAEDRVAAKLLVVSDLQQAWREAGQKRD